MATPGAEIGDGTGDIGRVLQGTYRLERRLGVGGMGAVYEASHLRLRRRFAVKMLTPAVSGNAEAVARFRREAQVTSEFGHPNIIEVVDFNQTEDGTPYIVMELLQGEDLAAALARRPRPDPQWIRSVVGQVASALEAAHERGIIHRDLKPSNLFLCKRQGDGSELVKVLDFGISKVIGSQSAMTQTLATMGTPHYMAPEQAEGHSAIVDARTDVFALGVILYEMLSGHPPFVGDSIPAVMYKVVHGVPPALRQERPDLSPAVEAVTMKALNKSPDQRYASIRELAQAVDVVLSGSAGPVSGDGQRAHAEVSSQDGGEAVAPVPGAPAEPAGPVVAPPKVTTLSASAGEYQLEPASRHRRRPLVIGTTLAIATTVVVMMLYHSPDQGTRQQRHLARSADPRDGGRAERAANGGMAPDRAAVLEAPQHTIDVASADARLTCELRSKGTSTAISRIPCRFVVRDGSVVQLVVRGRGQGVARERWTVRENRALRARTRRDGRIELIRDNQQRDASSAARAPAKRRSRRASSPPVGSSQRREPSDQKRKQPAEQPRSTPQPPKRGISDWEFP